MKNHLKPENYFSVGWVLHVVEQKELWVRDGMSACCPGVATKLAGGDPEEEIVFSGHLCCHL